MSDDSTTVDAGSTGPEVDDFDLSAEDGPANNPDAPTDDQQTDDTKVADDDLASDKSDKKADDADDKPADDAAKPDDKAPALDADLDDWAEKTGHPKPENDEDRAKLQTLRDSRREFTRERLAKKNNDVGKAIDEAKPKTDTKTDDADPAMTEIAKVKADLATERATRMRSEYFSENDVTAEESAAMVDIIKETGEKGNQTRFDYLADPANMEDLHVLAQRRIAAAKTADDTSDVADKARADERERIAKESKAAGPNKSAKSTQTKEKKSELDEMWDPAND